jgi:phenylpropionate dioxygenase-like ring-hydroxylating dioxygenase large terminal subunit
MTTKAETEILTRVGPGTPMGEVMRQYWIPAAKSSEVEADGQPLRLVLLGEQLIAFRDTSGRVGIMDHRCPHRCASMFFGRNENDGITCTYHGWKFDVAGNCVDMPNVPAHQDFKDKVTAKAYHVAERNGLIWVHMGAQTEPPALPALEAAQLSEADVNIQFIQRECNWLQALEGDIDTSHFGFLHFGGVGPNDFGEEEIARNVVKNRAPEYTVTESDWGMMYGGYREAEPGVNYWRIAHFLFPFWTMPPHGPIGDHVWCRGWVPMDDTHVMHVELSWKNRTLGMRARKDGSPVPGIKPSAFLPNTSDWYGRWMLSANARTDYLIDRDSFGDVYSGISGIFEQDHAMVESMGAIVDHGFEHLAPSDEMITSTRRRLIMAAAALEKDGTPPPGAEDPSVFGQPRGGDFLADEGAEWIDTFKQKVAELDNRIPLATAAE